jgi:hypothetical protein
MKVDGRCHCGEITFEAEVDPNSLNTCHCTDCQTLSGSAFRANIPAPAEHFVLRGTPKTYIKAAESGNKRLPAFCGNCGTPIYACAVDNPQSYGLRIGTIKHRAILARRRKSWRPSALPWVDGLATVPAIQRVNGAASSTEWGAKYRTTRVSSAVFGEFGKRTFVDRECLVARRPTTVRH